MHRRTSIAVMSADTRRGITMILLAAMLWGTTGTAQSFLPSGLPSVWVGALRLLVASLFFGLVWLSAPRPPAGRFEWRWLLLAGLCIAAYNLAFFAGVRATGIAVGTAVAIGSGPIWAGLLQWMSSGRWPSAAWWGGTLLAVAGGALLVIEPGNTQALSSSGVVLCLLAGLSYAAYALINKRLVVQADPGQVTGIVFGIAALVALPAAWLNAGVPALNAGGLGVVLYLGVVATGLSYLLFSRALRHVSGSTGVTLALGEPVTAFGLAVLVVGERPGWLALAGLLAVLAGLAWVIRVETRTAPAG